MTFHDDITAMRARITKAESERDTWRASGMQEKYLEAYSLVEALEVDLERMRQEGLRTFLKRSDPVPAPLPPEPPGENERSMAESSIVFNGRHYQYGSYRYDFLADALDYAGRQRLGAPGSDELGPTPPAQRVESPDESQRPLMAALAITFDAGVYHWGAYRYDRLADAVNYARLQHPQASYP